MDDALESPAPDVPAGIQRALYVGDQPFAAADVEGFDRVQAGWEFCAVRIGSEERARETVRAAARAGVPLTLVTPPARDPHLGLVMAAVAEFAGRFPGGEVVVNDWGVLHEVRRAFPSLVRILGRLLFRMHRDPDSPMLARPVAGGSAAGISVLDSPAFRRLVADFGIARVEADAVLPLAALPAGREVPVAISVHAPFRFLSQTFSCRAADLLRAGPPMPVDACQRECDGVTMQVGRGRGRPREIQVGNAVFMHDGMPRLDAPGPGIDRLVLRRHPSL